MGFMGADQPWPEHKSPGARRALLAAKEAGWRFRPATGHSFGTLKCPDLDDPCRVAVYSTSGSRDGSDTAKLILRAVRGCNHGGERVEPDGSSVDDEDLVRMVDLLLDAAAALAERSAIEARVMTAAEADDGDAFEMFGQRFVQADNDAAVRFAALGRPTEPWPPAVAAHELVNEAERCASVAVDPTLGAALSSRVAAFRTSVVI